MKEMSENVWLDYQSRLRSFIFRRVADRAAVDDILQEVFLKMDAGLASLKDQTRLQSWLYRIAGNAISDYYRRLKPTVEIPEWLSRPEADPGEKVIEELATCLQPMIENLPDKYRETVVLSEMQGLRLQEVARRQGISLSGVKSRVQRGRALLQTMIVECCRLEFDHRGRLCGYECKTDAAEKC